MAEKFQTVQVEKLKLKLTYSIKKERKRNWYLLVPSIQYPSNLTRFLCLTCPNASTSAMKSSSWQLMVIVQLKAITVFLLNDITYYIVHYKSKITIGWRLVAQNSLGAYLYFNSFRYMSISIIVQSVLVSTV